MAKPKLIPDSLEIGQALVRVGMSIRELSVAMRMPMHETTNIVQSRVAPTAYQKVAMLGEIEAYRLKNERRQ